MWIGDRVLIAVRASRKDKQGKERISGSGETTKTAGRGPRMVGGLRGFQVLAVFDHLRKEASASAVSSR